MAKYLFLALALSSLLLQGCDGDSFSQVTTIELPEHEPKPALRLQLRAGETSASMLLSNSKGILDPESSYRVYPDATVQLFKNGSLMADFVFDEDESMHHAEFAQPMASRAGDVYIVEATAPGFEPVSATQVMPPQPIITRAVFRREGTIDSNGDRVDELVVDLEDQEPGRANYFAIALQSTFYQVDQNGDTLAPIVNRVWLDSNDPLLSYGGEFGLIFTDEGFSGGKYQVRCYSYSNFGEPERNNLEVLVYQLTRDTYLYVRSKDQYWNALDNPFAEPVRVHTNVEGGYGIFTLANRRVMEVEIE